MNITFTKEELEKFYNSVGEWSEKAMAHLLKEIAANRTVFEIGNPIAFLRDRLAEFREKNPQPTWRSLL